MTRFRSIRLLFVEDNTDDIEIARRALRASDAVGDVRLARDGQEAVEALLEGAAGADGRDRRPGRLVLGDVNVRRCSRWRWRHIRYRWRRLLRSRRCSRR